MGYRPLRDRARWDRRVPRRLTHFNAGMWNREKWYETALTQWGRHPGRARASIKRGVTAAGNTMHAQTGALSVKTTSNRPARGGTLRRPNTPKKTLGIASRFLLALLQT